jgi:gas vesicle protein
MILNKEQEDLPMNIKEILVLINKEKRNRERRKIAQMIAVGSAIVAGVATGMIIAPKFKKHTKGDLKKKAVSTIENINDTVQKNAETVRDSAIDDVQKAFNRLEKGHEKMEGVKKEIKDGYHEIVKDVNDTAEDISDEFNSSRRKRNGKK